MPLSAPDSDSTLRFLRHFIVPILQLDQKPSAMLDIAALTQMDGPNHGTAVLKMTCAHLPHLIAKVRGVF